MPTIVDFPTVVKAALDAFGDLFANERVNRNGIQFRYNSFPIKQLRRLAHFVLFWQDGGIHSHYP